MKKVEKQTKYSAKAAKQNQLKEVLSAKAEKPKADKQYKYVLSKPKQS